MNKKHLVEDLRMTQEYFERATSCFKEEHSGFVPSEGMFTVAQQVTHTATSIDWLIDGGFGPDGFNLDFEGFAKNTQVNSLQEARKMFKDSIENAVSTIEGQSEEQLSEPILDEEILTGMPKAIIPGAIADHTAHHRGVLTMYARLLGMVAPFPYKDMAEMAPQ